MRGDAVTTRATFDATAVGADLALERGDTVLTYTTSADIDDAEAWMADKTGVTL